LKDGKRNARGNVPDRRATHRRRERRSRASSGVPVLRFEQRKIADRSCRGNCLRRNRDAAWSALDHL